jgi:FAD/FMN-containing dehydrogenase/Fe-S oxidoreductase
MDIAHRNVTRIVTREGDGPSKLGTVETQAVRGGRKTGKTRQTVASGDLADALSAAIEGEVRFDDGSRALYATDGSNYRQVPIGVVVPKSVDDAVKAVAVARAFDAPVLGRGCGTSLAGQCCNTAVVLDFSKYLRRVHSIDPVKKLAVVDPGCVLDDLRDAAEKHKLTFGPDPATHTHCTLGGMCGNNSCGVHSVLAAFHGSGPRTADNIESLEILTYDGLRMEVPSRLSEDELDAIVRAGGRRGEIHARLREIRDRYAPLIRERFPKIPRRVSGYNLDMLLPENGFNLAGALVGTEGTCVTLLRITARLCYSPPVRSLLVLGYPSVYDAGRHVTQVMAHRPTGCEGIDHKLIGYYRKKGLIVEDIKLLPEGKGFLLVEFGGETREESDAKARALMADLEKDSEVPSMSLFDSREEEEKVWKVRESGLGATAFVPGQRDAWPGWEDSAVPPERVGEYLHALRDLFQKYDYDPSLYGHFGQGCIHCRIQFDLQTHDGLKKYRSFMEEAADLVVGMGGSLSGEHGDGQARAELLPRMFGPELVRAFEEFKDVWDPANRMNPGKVVRPYSMTENLRLGANFEPAHPKTYFQYPDDHGDFMHATMRCVGVGKCRREKGGVMCPSYMVTHEEKHATRGRARLLFEMLGGEELKGGWKEEAVKEALDLCLACKGCKGECPVNVDMATYKAEFLAHYYKGRIRPRHAYAFGLIDKWSRIASRIPGLVNLVNHAPLASSVVKWFVGMAQPRTIPRYAAQSFRDWWFSRKDRVPASSPDRLVVLWPDTFNDNFHPRTARAAVEVLEAAGWTVEVPRAYVCCGRPLYDYGFLDLARQYLERVLHVMRPYIRSGVPIVVLEPSCASVFRDEMKDLMGHDEDAMRMTRLTFLLSEFLEEKAKDWEPPSIGGKGLLQGHCHHKAVLKLTAMQNVFKRMGMEIEAPESGCCGMAGAFGFETGEHYDVSVKCGERVIIPRVREAADDTFIIADGFSCRQQIEEMTDRRALHLADVLAMGLHPGARRPGERPEARRVGEVKAEEKALRRRALAAVGGGAALLALGAALWRRTRG